MWTLSRSPTLRWPLLGAGILLLLGFGATIWHGLLNPTPAAAQECRASISTSERVAAAAKGEVAALVATTPPKPSPQISFTGPKDEPLSLDAFKGKVALVNLWATWCVPCRKEMPALDKLQAELGGPAFEVVAINVDTRNPEKPRAWLQDNGIGRLAYYSDFSGKLLQVLQRSGHVVGLPATLLIDATGCEVGLLKGPAEWASPDATALIKAALNRP
jgi:thiol-disulfide isomerase/thioredoxin